MPYRARLSIELNILIESLRHGFMPDDGMALTREQLHSHTTGKLRKLVQHHRIKPLLLEFDRAYNFLDPEFRQELEKNQLRQVTRNLHNIKVTQDILKRLAGHDIPCVLMKGSLFINTIYRNRQLREVRDIDILCGKDDIPRVIEILRGEGFRLKLRGRKIDDENETRLSNLLLASEHFNEISLSRDGVNIDLHWELCKPYNGINFKAEQVFTHAAPADFYGYPGLAPDPEYLYWMMLVHHGGVERWSKLKFISDLLAWRHTYGDRYDDEVLLRDARSFLLENAHKNGRWILENIPGSTVVPPP